MRENEKKLRAAFQDDVLHNSDQMAAFFEIEEMMAEIDPTLQENIFYPENMLPSDMPKLVADMMSGKAEAVQMFDITGKEVQI